MTEQGLLQIVLLWSSLAVLAAWLPWPRWQSAMVGACGAGLLATVSPPSLALLAAGTGASFALQRYARSNKRLMLAGVAPIAAVFFLFLAGATHAAAHGALRVVLPLGLAFYALRLIHYLLESYKGNLRPHHFGEYLCYQFLPATLPTGPIHRFDEFLRDVRRRRWDPALFSYGAQRVLYGLVKLVVLGNYLIAEELTPALNHAVDHTGWLATYAWMVLFWLKLYILFSGYSDVAVGFAALMGLRIRENFNFPFIARNISDFWRRWHSSLSSWCRDYVFTPVLAATRRPSWAVLAAMIVLGLWHAISLHYLLWGAWHGSGIAAFRWFDAQFGARIEAFPRLLAALWTVLATLITLHFVIFSFPATRLIEQLVTGT